MNQEKNGYPAVNKSFLDQFIHGSLINQKLSVERRREGDTILNNTTLKQE